MTRYYGDFLDRYPEDEFEDDEAVYRRARRDHYGNIGGGFPGSQHFDDAYNAEEAWQRVDRMKNPAQATRNAYERRLGSANRFVDGLAAEEAAYYRNAMGSSTPRDHRDLQPLARDYADSEYRHA
ncbi:MAG: hypothetical protein Q9226_008116 [Calogaya cf. arnoldii]